MFNVQEIDTNLNHNMNGPFDRLIFSPAIHQTGEHSPKNINQKDPELIQRIYPLPVGLLAQLEERCTGIAEVMSSNPVWAKVFFRSHLQLLVSVVFLAARIS